MKIRRNQIDRSELLGRDANTSGIVSGIEFRLNAQARSRRRMSDQLDQDGVTHQRFSAPIERELAKQAVFNLVPFAGPGREMADVDRHSQFVRQGLQRHFPQATPAAVTPPAIGGNQQFACLRIQQLAQAVPPSANRRCRKSRGIVVNPDTDPARSR